MIKNKQSDFNNIGIVQDFDSLRVRIRPLDRKKDNIPKRWLGLYNDQIFEIHEYVNSYIVKANQKIERFSTLLDCFNFIRASFGGLRDMDFDENEIFESDFRERSAGR